MWRWSSDLGLLQFGLDAFQIQLINKKNTCTYIFNVESVRTTYVGHVLWMLSMGVRGVNSLAKRGMRSGFLFCECCTFQIPKTRRIPNSQTRMESTVAEMLGLRWEARMCVCAPTLHRNTLEMYSSCLC